MEKWSYPEAGKTPPDEDLSQTWCVPDEYTEEDYQKVHENVIRMLKLRGCEYILTGQHKKDEKNLKEKKESGQADENDPFKYLSDEQQKSFNQLIKPFAPTIVGYYPSNIACSEWYSGQFDPTVSQTDKNKKEDYNMDTKGDQDEKKKEKPAIKKEMLQVTVFFVSLARHRLLTIDMLRKIVYLAIQENKMDHVIVIANQMNLKSDQRIQEQKLSYPLHKLELFATDFFDNFLLDHLLYVRTNPMALTKEQFQKMTKNIKVKEETDWIQIKPWDPIVRLFGLECHQDILFIEMSKNVGVYPTFRHVGDSTM